MKITDKEVITMMDKAKVYEVKESVLSYPDDERDGRSDMQILADEASWLLQKYNTDGWSQNEWLKESRRILRETKHGKEIPLWESTLKPVYREGDINEAKDCVNGYKRLQNLVKRLEAKGFYGRWR